MKEIRSLLLRRRAVDQSGCWRAVFINALSIPLMASAPRNFLIYIYTGTDIIKIDCVAGANKGSFVIWGDRHKSVGRLGMLKTEATISRSFFFLRLEESRAEPTSDDVVHH